MNNTREKRLRQMNDETLIIGVDIAKEIHVARAFDYRGIELEDSIEFANDYLGFSRFKEWIKRIKKVESKIKLIIGMEPTGPYWLNLARDLKRNDISIVTVNPKHVKDSKELDDNSQTKTDYKDAGVIAGLVKDARYSKPNLLEGSYEELRNSKKLLEMIDKDVSRTKNQVINWLDRFFPEYKYAYKDWESKSFIKFLKEYTFPSIISKKTVEELYTFLPSKQRRGVGRRKISHLIAVAKKSVGILEGLEVAKFEIEYLLKKYETFEKLKEKLMKKIEEISKDLPEVKKLVKIKGFGLKTASIIIAELGDLNNYDDAKQVIKMAGLSLVEHSSGKHKGKVKISKRGRSTLRKTLYLVMVGMVGSNKVFKKLHQYYTGRRKNQLEKKASIIALCRKLIRIIYTIITKDLEYDEEKILKDIQWPEEFLISA